jgi:hypothetical protein
MFLSRNKQLSCLIVCISDSPVLLLNQPYPSLCISSYHDLLSVSAAILSHCLYQQFSCPTIEPTLSQSLF